jgi:hypothetical protein
VAKHGESIALSDKRFQESREARIGALAALGWSKYFKTEYWITTPINDPPDVLMISYTKQLGGTAEEIQNIEIAEWESHSPHNLIVDAICSKLKAKSYPPNTILLVFVHSREAKISTTEAFAELKGLPINIAAIWILGSTRDEEKAWGLVAEVYPNHRVCKFDINEELDKLKDQDDVVILKRGLGEKTELSGWGLDPLP